MQESLKDLNVICCACLDVHQNQLAPKLYLIAHVESRVLKFIDIVFNTVIILR